MIREERATEMAAYLLSKDKYGEMHYKKLMGLMYLSERRFMKIYYDLICDDYFEAKEHGPVLSETYKLMEGKRVSRINVWDSEKEEDVPFDIWSSMINKLDDDNYISVKERLIFDDIEELSEEGCEIIDEIWGEFGNLTEQQLREYIQRNCSEWEQTIRTNGRKYEGYKESFPNQITIEVIGEQMGFSQYDIDGIKASANY